MRLLSLLTNALRASTFGTKMYATNTTDSTVPTLRMEESYQISETSNFRHNFTEQSADQCLNCAGYSKTMALDDTHCNVRSEVYDLLSTLAEDGKIDVLYNFRRTLLKPKDHDPDIAEVVKIAISNFEAGMNSDSYTTFCSKRNLALTSDCKIAAQELLQYTGVSVHDLHFQHNSCRIVVRGSEDVTYNRLVSQALAIIDYCSGAENGSMHTSGFVRGSSSRPKVCVTDRDYNC